MKFLTSLITLLVGTAIIWFTSYVQTVAEAPPIFSSFYLLGAIFISYTVYNIVLWYITQKGKNEQETNKHTLQHCPKCGTSHYKESNYCHMCGTKL